MVIGSGCTSIREQEQRPSVNPRCDECSPPYHWRCWGQRGPRRAQRWPSGRAPSSARRCPLGWATKFTPSRASPTLHPPLENSDLWLDFLLCFLFTETLSNHIYCRLSLLKWENNFTFSLIIATGDKFQVKKISLCCSTIFQPVFYNFGCILYVTVNGLIRKVKKYPTASTKKVISIRLCLFWVINIVKLCLIMILLIIEILKSLYILWNVDLCNFYLHKSSATECNKLTGPYQNLSEQQHNVIFFCKILRSDWMRLFHCCLLSSSSLRFLHHYLLRVSHCNYCSYS